MKTTTNKTNLVLTAKVLANGNKQNLISNVSFVAKYKMQIIGITLLACVPALVIILKFVFNVNMNLD